MKIETPQILWHGNNDDGKNAPLYALSLLESGFSGESLTSYGHVLATAGNTSDIHLWKVSFHTSAEPSRRILQQGPATHNIQHMLTLARHDRSVNTIAFSPDGLHLATAGDGGSIIVWSVPPSKRGNGNGRHFWSTLTKETDLMCRIVSSSCEGICDISWSADSKRFVAGSIDHAVLVYEDLNYDANQAAAQTGKPQIEPQWRPVSRNARDHTHFVQGVTYDPLGVYVCSMGSDRTVRIYSRKTPPKAKKKVLRPKNPNSGILVPPEHQRVVDRVLAETKFELSTKGKTLKYRQVPTTDDDTTAPKKQYLFADESTVESFFRRLDWTADGAFLVTPAALWHPEEGDGADAVSPSFATYMFARHRFDEPYMVLSGLEKPSVAVRPNPVLFKLPDLDPMDCKENGKNDKLPYRSIFAVLTVDTVLIYDTHHTRPLCIARGLHYAGLTDCAWSPDGRHLLATSTDGYLSILSFAEGELGQVYTPPATAQVAISTLTEEENDDPVSPVQQQGQISPTSTQHEASSSRPVLQQQQPQATTAPAAAANHSPRIPPCEPGQSATLEARPAKKARTRITPTLVTPAPNNCNNKKKQHDLVTAAAVTECVKEGVTQLSLEQSGEPPKKKKRIQPTLLSINQ